MDPAQTSPCGANIGPAQLTVRPEKSQRYRLPTNIQVQCGILIFFPHLHLDLYTRVSEIFSAKSLPLFESIEYK